jgi:hypothetical protein
MSNLTNRRITLAARPVGAPKDTDFQLIEEPVAEIGPRQVLLRTIYLSLDPYMRGRMNAVTSYAPFVGIGETMVGGAVSTVISSNHSGYKAGDIVFGYTGWQEYALDDGSKLRTINPARAPISTALGVLGMPGLTAYVGLLDIGQPMPGETVVVSAASGAVGAVVGQIAKIKGCRVVGIAGAEEKCKYVVDTLGFDACVNHRSEKLAAELATACPNGVDVYFENVGGQVFQAILGLLNADARIPVCGVVSHYNDTELPPGPDSLPKFSRAILTKRLKVQGFIIFYHTHREAAFFTDMTAWLNDSKVRYREDIVEGIEQAVGAFQGLLEGRNFGKLLVQVSDDPTRDR